MSHFPIFSTGRTPSIAAGTNEASTASVLTGHFLEPTAGHPPAAALASQIEALVLAPYRLGIRRTLEALGGAVSTAQAALLLTCAELFSLPPQAPQNLIQRARALEETTHPSEWLETLIHLRQDPTKAQRWAQTLGLEETTLIHCLDFAPGAFNAESVQPPLEEACRAFRQAIEQLKITPMDTSSVLHEVACLAEQIKRALRAQDPHAPLTEAGLQRPHTRVRRADPDQAEPPSARKKQARRLDVESADAPPPPKRKNGLDLPETHPDEPGWHKMPSPIDETPSSGAGQPVVEKIEQLNEENSVLNLLADLYGYDLYSDGQCELLALGGAFAALESETARTRGPATALKNFLSWFSLKAGSEANVLALSALVDLAEISKNRFSGAVTGNSGLEKGGVRQKIKALQGQLKERHGLYYGAIRILSEHPSDKESIQGIKTNTSSIETLLKQLEEAKVSTLYSLVCGVQSYDELSKGSSDLHTTTLMVAVNPSRNEAEPERTFLFFDPNQGYIAETQLSVFRQKLKNLLVADPAVLGGGETAELEPPFYTQPYWDAKAQDRLSAIRVIASEPETLGDGLSASSAQSITAGQDVPSPSIDRLSAHSADEEQTRLHLIEQYRPTLDQYFPKIAAFSTVINDINRFRNPQDVSAVLEPLDEEVRRAIRVLTSEAFLSYLETLKPYAARWIVKNTLMRDFTGIDGVRAPDETGVSDNFLGSVSATAEAYLMLVNAKFNTPILPEVSWAGQHAPVVARVAGLLSPKSYYDFIYEKDKTAARINEGAQQALQRADSRGEATAYLGGRKNDQSAVQNIFQHIDIFQHIEQRGVSFTNACLRVWLAQEAQIDQQKQLGQVASYSEEQRLQAVLSRLKPWLDARDPVSENAQFQRIMIDPLGISNVTAQQQNLSEDDLLSRLTKKERLAVLKGMERLRLSGRLSQQTEAMLILLPELSAFIVNALLTPPIELESVETYYREQQLLNKIIRFGYDRDPKQLARLLCSAYTSVDYLEARLQKQLATSRIALPKKARIKPNIVAATEADVDGSASGIAAARGSAQPAEAARAAPPSQEGTFVPQKLSASSHPAPAPMDIPQASPVAGAAQQLPTPLTAGTQPPAPLPNPWVNWNVDNKAVRGPTSGSGVFRREEKFYIRHAPNDSVYEVIYDNGYRYNPQGGASYSGAWRLVNPEDRGVLGPAVVEQFGGNRWVLLEKNELITPPIRQMLGGTARPGLKGGDPRRTLNSTALAPAEVSTSSAVRAIPSGEKAGQALVEAFTELQKADPEAFSRVKSYTPLIVDAQDKNGRISIPFVNPNSTTDPAIVLSSDKPSVVGAIVAVRDQINALARQWESAAALQTSGRESPEVLGRPAAIDEAAPNTLNAGFFIQGVIHAVQNGTPNDKVSAAHLYLNLAQAAHGLISDVGAVTRLIVQPSSGALRSMGSGGEATVRLAGQAGETAGVQLSQVLKVASRFERFATKQPLFNVLPPVGAQISKLGAKAAQSASTAFGGFLSVVNLGFDGYEVYRDPSEVNTAQLGVDTFGAGMSAAAFGATAAGAETTGAVLGPLAVPVSGLGVGIIGLVKAFMPIGEGAQRVGSYFNQLDSVYRDGGYSYDATQNAYLPFPEAVVEKLSFSGDQLSITCGSQKLYRTIHDGIGTDVSRIGGNPHYIPWAGHFPHVLEEKKQALDVRSAIGHQATHQLQGGPNAAIVLPATPTTYLSSRWELWPGALTRHDAGFDVLRKMTREKKYFFDFYCFPGEYITYKMESEPVLTTAEIRLDGADRQLVVPKLPAETNRYLAYQIEGNGGTYRISINTCASIQLNEGDPNRSSNWVLDATALGDGSALQFTEEGLRVHGLAIRVPAANRQGTFTLIGLTSAGAHQQWTLDWAHQKATVSALQPDAHQTKADLETMLNRLAQQQALPMDYVIVDHAIEGQRPDERLPIRAYYDVKGKQLLYTHPNNDVVRTADERLLAQNADSVYFSDAEGAVWRTGVQDHQLKVHYRLLTAPGVRTLNAHQTGDQLLLTQQLQRGPNVLPTTINLRYTIDTRTDQVQLSEIHVNGRLSDPDLPSSLNAEALLDALAGTNAGRPELADVVSIVEIKDQKQTPCWWRKSDGRLIRPNGAVFNQPVPVAARVDTVRPAANALWAGTTGHGKDEVAYFYLPNDKALYRQAIGATAEATREPLGPLDQVIGRKIGRNGELHVLQSDGVVRVLSQKGVWQATGIQAQSLPQTDWATAIKAKVVEPALAVIELLGLQNAEGQPIPAWFDRKTQQQILAPTLAGRSVRLLAVVDEGTTALLSDGHKLYLQPTKSEASAAAAQPQANRL